MEVKSDIIEKVYNETINMVDKPRYEQVRRYIELYLKYANQSKKDQD